jgi:5'-phosphate synthase pdxT subunit
MRVGVLALQGGFAPHAAVLASIGHEPVPVRDPDALADVAGLVLPGGESTAQLRLIDRQGLRDALDELVESGKPVLATCAGLVLAARRVVRPEQASFGWIDVEIARNAWGRQVDSFEAVADDGSLPLVFIRAPRVVEVGRDVRILTTYRGEPVLVRQKNVTAASFHPELTGDPRVHVDVFGYPDCAPFDASC